MHCICAGLCTCLPVPTKAKEHLFLRLEAQAVVLGTKLQSAKAVCTLTAEPPFPRLGH